MKRTPKRKWPKRETTLERFLDKCEFDPRTGCVLWIGGTSAGRGHSARYGVLKVKNPETGKLERWFAHRWSAKHIHGQDIDDKQVDHHCEIGGPNTLCVQHVMAVPPSVNRELQWIRVQVGIDPEPVGHNVDQDEPPFFLPPAWLQRKAPPDEGQG